MGQGRGTGGGDAHIVVGWALTVPRVGNERTRGGKNQQRLDILVTWKRGNGKALEAAWAARPAHAQQVAAWNAAVAEREKEHVLRVRMGCKNE